MGKITYTNKPETRESEEITIVNGIVCTEKVKEVITSRKVTETYISVDELKENTLFFSHTNISYDFNYITGIKMYFTDTMKGKKITELLTDENGETVCDLNIAVVKEDGSVDMTTARYMDASCDPSCLGTDKYYRVVGMYNAEYDTYSLFIRKTNYVLFKKAIRRY